MKNIARISMLPAAAFCSAVRRREVRPAGAREPAPSTSAGSRRPDARTGRGRARRLSLLLPVLALLLGALGLFAPAPAEAQRAGPTVTATAGDASVRVNWTFTDTDPADWEIEYGVHPSGSTSTVTEFSSGARSRTITGLTNATTYRFRVRGINARPTQWSGWVTATPQAATPGDPTGVTVTPGNAQLSVSWTAPSGTVTGYDVHYTSSSTVAAGATVQTVSAAAGWLAHPTRTATDTSTSQTISSLMNGTPYRVRVRAKNTAGDSAWVVKSGTPSAPSATAVWSATLTPQTVTGGVGCLTKSQCDSRLTDNSFTVGGTDYHFTFLVDFSATGLQAAFNAVPNATLRALKFCVGTTGYEIGAGISQALSASAIGWSAGTPVSLSIDTSCTAQMTQSTNANLSGLTVGSSTSSGGQYTDFSIGTFGATTTTYTASVANDQTHVKLTPTVADTGKATVGVRKGQGSFTAVTSGSASSAIALDVGANTLTVRVTAEDTTTTKDYTVTVTRRQAQQTLSTNADLSGLTAGSATSSTGTFTNFSIGTFAATTTSYSASVANDRTHVKLTPTVADTGKATVTVAGNAVNSGSASGPIALSVGANAITVRVTAEDTTTTKDYTVTVTRQALPAKVTTAVSGTMTVGDGGSWKGFRATPVVGALSDADFTYGGVDYRILGLRLGNSGYLALHLNKALDRNWGLVLNVGDSRFRIADAVLSTGPGYEGVIAGWFYSNQGETPPSWTVGDTVPVSLGTLTSSTVKLSVSPNPVNEGASASVEACLSAVPQGTVRIPVTLSHGTSEDGDWGVSLTGDTDGRLPISTAYTIAISGWLQRGCGVVNIPTHPDSDADDETFTVALDTASLPPGVRAGSPASVVVRIKDLTDLPEVTLRAVRRTVAEGSPVELQVALTEPLATDVAIPLRVRWVTSETADHGFVRSITIAAGATSGSGTIRTYEDDDTDDERFQVAVIQPDLPEGVAPGSPSTVGITIVDAANARLRALDLNSGN